MTGNLGPAVRITGTTLVNAARPVDLDPLYHLRPDPGHGQPLATLTVAATDNAEDLPCTDREDDFLNWDAPGRQAPTDEEAVVMCQGCPIFAECSDYATRARPFGVWAGVVYGREEQNGGLEVQQ